MAQARGQYPAAVGRAFARVKAKPAIFEAYNELYELSFMRPHRTVTFRGFGEGELRAADAAMIVPPPAGSLTLAPLPSHADEARKLQA